MQQKKEKHNIILIIVLSAIFGLASGIVGNLVARVYVLESSFNIPFYGEIDFSSDQYRGQNIIIRGAKKVVVEQNEKVTETIKSARGSLVGIFKKKIGVKILEGQANRFNIDNYYKLGQEIAQGLIITSDGWIITSFKPKNLDYVIITSDKKVYSIDKVVSDTLTPFHFLHVSASDFPVRKFAESDDIKNGQAVLLINWRGDALMNSIVDSADNNGDLLHSSDSFFSKINLAQPVSDEFKGSFLFNLSGDVVGLSDKSGQIEPINHFTSAVKSLLTHKAIRRPVLGVNYIDLSKLVSVFPKNSGRTDYKNGALIYRNSKGISVAKGSIAEKMGLKEGDVIISVEGNQINDRNNLTDIIQKFISGDTVNIVFMRDGTKEEIDVEL
jgi:S1-C subfamily serine protease